MADRLTANFTKAQAKLLGAFQEKELRYRYPVTYLAMKLSGAIMFPNYNELLTREDRVIETNYKVRNKKALSTGGRLHNHTGSKSDTSTLTPTWDTYGQTFNVSLKQADNSLYSLDEQLMQEIEESVANFAEGMETLATQYIFDSRTGVNGATAEGTFDTALGENVFKITESTHGTRAIQITKSVMHANKYSNSNLAVFCDTTSYNKFESDAAQGAQNQTNLSFQFNGVTFIHSVELGALGGGLTGAYAKGFWIVAEMGTFGVLPWIPKQNRNGVDTKVSKYYTMMNPVDGFSYAVHEYETRADDSANNGFTQDVVTQYELTIDQSLVQAPLSVANETVFYAFALV